MIFRAIRHFGDLLDRWDVGGWLLLASGMVVLSVTLLAPAYVENRHLDAQVLVLTRQAQMLEKQHANYENFIKAVKAGDPELLQRLAWHHLRLKPADTDLLGGVTVLDSKPVPSVDEWTQADIPPLPDNLMDMALPDSRLVRLVMGPSRPWVFAFGGWLILMGLLINPSAARTKPVKVMLPQPAPAPIAITTSGLTAPVADAAADDV